MKPTSEMQSAMVVLVITPGSAANLESRGSLVSKDSGQSTATAKLMTVPSRAN
jgi:hypothetical protein